ncbi:MAG TPA: hypothetical protein VFL55_22570 [Acetobacteraceae bacterium]|nr:hypothetical protein [Acetobacteraceae bacterium]
MLSKLCIQLDDFRCQPGHGVAVGGECQPFAIAPCGPGDRGRKLDAGDSQIGEASLHQHCPGIGAEFGVHHEVVAADRRISMKAGRQTAAAARQPTDDGRHGEAESAARRQDTPALSETAYRILHMLQRVGMHDHIERTIGEAQAKHVVLRISRNGVLRQLPKNCRERSGLVDFEHPDPARRWRLHVVG